jgi:hypothetical protein
LMFSTFLNPFFAAGATALVLGLPALAGQTVAPRWADVIPVYSLVAIVLKSSYRFPGRPVWFPILLALGEMLIFWGLSAQIFWRVDIAVAVE